MFRPPPWRAATMVVLAVVTGAGRIGAQAPSTLTLTDAIGRAVQANRTLVAARAARAIDTAGVQAAGQRPNPEVSFEAARETPHWAFTGIVPLELSGKRQRRVDVANATLAVTEAETARITADVRADVRRAYYQTVGALRRVAIAEELEAIQGRVRDAAQDRFQAGAAPRLEALQAGLALAQAQNEAVAARGDLTAARADLNALLAFPLDASPALADSLEAGQLPSPEAAAQQVMSANAELQVLQRRIDEERARVALAKAMRRPDPSVTASLTYDAPGEFTFGWRAGAAIALPIFTTGRPDLAVAEATLARAVADREARVAQITGAVSAALARAAAARQSVDRYRTEILPASLQVEQMAEESYRAGQTGLPAYLQTLQAAREIRQRALQAGLDYQLALADLERAMGTPLR
ncbi:MAG TPA: TolC family protein [Vicinamibacterales bacterium]|nr:TolC family protein [Vicinamibacterales bacterium]